MIVHAEFFWGVS